MMEGNQFQLKNGNFCSFPDKSVQVQSWSEENCYCSEPVYIAEPGEEHEDSGLLICSLLWGKPRVTSTAILILSARDLSPVARLTSIIYRKQNSKLCENSLHTRVSFKLPGPVPKPLHGSFLPSWDFQDLKEENSVQPPEI